MQDVMKRLKYDIYIQHQNAMEHIVGGGADEVTPVRLLPELLPRQKTKLNMIWSLNEEEMSFLMK